MLDEIIIPKGSIRTMKKDLGLARGGKVDFSAPKKSEPIIIFSKPIEKPEVKPLTKEVQVQKEQPQTEMKVKEQVSPNITAENFKKRQIEEEERRMAQIKMAAEAIEARNKEQERIEQEREALERKAREEREKEEAKKREEEEKKKLILIEAGKRKARILAEEEKRKAQILAEEEKRKAQILAEKARREFENSAEGRKITLNKKQEEVKIERMALQGEVDRSSSRVKNLNSAKAEILNAIKKLKLSFKEIVYGEKRIKEEARLIEEKEEKAINPNEKKQIEEKRWKMEKRRRDFEQKRWPWDDKLKNLENKLDNIDIEIRDANFEKEKINKRQSDLFAVEEKVRIELEKIGIDEEIKKMAELKKSSQAKKEEALKLLSKIEIDLSDIVGREKIAEDEKRNIDNQERSVIGIDSRRDLEKQRWQIEEKRRDIEKQRWAVDEAAQTARAQLKSAEERLAIVEIKEKNLKNRANEIDAKLGVKQSEVKPVQPLVRDLPKQEAATPTEKFAKPAEVKNNIGKNLAAVNNQLAAEGISKERQKEAIIEIENARKRIETLKIEAAEARRQKSEELIKENERVTQENKEGKEPTKEEIEESLELDNKNILEEEKRRKDLLNRLKSPLSGKEFGLNAGFYKTFPGVAQKQKEAENNRDQNNIVQGAQNEIAKPLAKKPPKGEKIWVRLFVVMSVITLLFANLTFWYWYFKIRNQTPVEQSNK